MRERIPLTEEMIVELLQHRGEGKGLRSVLTLSYEGL